MFKRDMFNSQYHFVVLADAFYAWMIDRWPDDVTGCICVCYGSKPTQRSPTKCGVVATAVLSAEKICRK